MTRPVTVGLVVSSPDWRGSVTSFAKVADALVATGHRAFFVTAHATLSLPLRERGYEVEQLGAVRTGLRELRGMRAILQRRQATALYADMPRDLRLAALTGRTVGARTAFRFNVNAGHTPDDLLTRLALRWTDAIVVQSEWATERVRRTAPRVAARPLHLINNGYDLAKWSRDGEARGKVRSRLGLAPDAPIVLCASAFARNKRQEFLIEALDRWPADQAVPTLVLAGGEEAKAPFLERARNSKVSIRYVGQPRAEELRELYSAADLVAQPAMNEAFGNVICEAMACEAVLVGPDAGSAPEQVGPASEGAGVILPPEDAAAWASAMAELVAQPERRSEIGRNARARIAREFPIEKMQRAHVTLLESLSR